VKGAVGPRTNTKEQLLVFMTENSFSEDAVYLSVATNLARKNSVLAGNTSFT